MALEKGLVQELLRREQAGTLTAAQRSDIGALRDAGRFPDALPTPEGRPSTRAATMPDGGSVLDIIRQLAGAVDPVGEMVTSRLAGERPQLEGAALAARTLPGLALPTANPLAIGAASAIGEAGAQGFEQAMGAREGYSGTEIVIAGATPVALTGAVRGGRALERTATRAVPGLFQRAQGRALAAADDIAARLTPDMEAGQLFASARSAGAEAVPAGRITAVLDDLDKSIGKTPADPGLKQVREAIGNIREVIKGKTVPLEALMQQRLDLGRLISRRGSAPELRAIYGHGGAKPTGIIGALEEAAEAGAAGASAAREALDVFKRDLGVVRWKELVEASTRRTSISGVDTPALNVAKLGDLVAKNSKELKGLLGADGLELIGGFLTKYRSLPPTHAATFANTLIALMAGAGGALAGGLSIPTALAGAVTPEIARNIFAVGRNPAVLNRTLAAIANATRGAVSMDDKVRVGPEAQDAARER